MREESFNCSLLSKRNCWVQGSFQLWKDFQLWSCSDLHMALLSKFFQNVEESSEYRELVGNIFRDGPEKFSSSQWKVYFVRFDCAAGYDCFNTTVVSNFSFFISHKSLTINIVNLVRTTLTHVQLLSHSACSSHYLLHCDVKHFSYCIWLW